jgi:hypothetical protein
MPTPSSSGLFSASLRPVRIEADFTGFRHICGTEARNCRLSSKPLWSAGCLILGPNRQHHVTRSRAVNFSARPLFWLRPPPPPTPGAVEKGAAVDPYPARAGYRSCRHFTGDGEVCNRANGLSRAAGSSPAAERECGPAFEIAAPDQTEAGCVVAGEDLARLPGQEAGQDEDAARFGEKPQARSEL